MKTSVTQLIVFFTVALGLGLMGNKPLHSGDSVSHQTGIDAELEETVYRYFTTNRDYKQGDLVARSHIQELQSYLRRTRGPIPAANPILLKRVVKDNSLLSRYFYRQGGAEVLRSASQQLGGYRELEALCVSIEGKQAILNAINEKSSAGLVQFAKGHEKPSDDSTKAQSPETSKSDSSFLDLRIYTAEDYLEAVRAAQKEQGNQKSPSDNVSEAGP